MLDGCSPEQAAAKLRSCHALHEQALEERGYAWLRLTTEELPPAERQSVVRLYVEAQNKLDRHAADIEQCALLSPCVCLVAKMCFSRVCCAVFSACRGLPRSLCAIELADVSVSAYHRHGICSRDIWAAGGAGGMSWQAITAAACGAGRPQTT